MMFDFFKKLFKNNKDKNAMDENKAQVNDMNASSNVQAKKVRKHKLEIQVYEADWEKADANNGQPQWRPVRSDPALDGGRPNIIEVANKAEFDEIQKQYAMCDQRIKVIREIDPFVDEPKKPQPQMIPQNNQAIPIETKMPQNHENVQHTQSTPIIDMSKAAQQVMNNQVTVAKPKPKIVTIGDVEVKYDGDKVYQKQWMKLTPAEASNFRIVTDSNNKVVSMAGKHVEAKRWVLLEDHNEDSIDDAVESILNN